MSRARPGSSSSPARTTASAGSLAATIRGVAIGADQQRHMVVRHFVANFELHVDFGKEGLDALVGEIGFEIEVQAVSSKVQMIVSRQQLPDSAARVRDCFREHGPTRTGSIPL